MSRMIRKQIYLEPSQEHLLKQRANELGVSEAELIRRCLATIARGRSPGYPHGYSTYQNARKQGVNPSTDSTGPRDDTHFPIDGEAL